VITAAFTDRLDYIKGLPNCEVEVMSDMSPVLHVDNNDLITCTDAFMTCWKAAVTSGFGQSWRDVEVAKNKLLRVTAALDDLLSWKRADAFLTPCVASEPWAGMLYLLFLFFLSPVFLSLLFLFFFSCLLSLSSSRSLSLSLSLFLLCRMVLNVRCLSLSLFFSLPIPLLSFHLSISLDLFLSVA